MTVAIDVHVHPCTEECIAKMFGDYMESAAQLYGIALKPVSIDEMAKYYKGLDIIANLVAVDYETTTGLPKVSNDFIAEAVRKHPDTFIGFGSVDPWKGKLAVIEVERAIKDLGLRGMKFVPQIQAFFPNDRRFYPIYEKCVELGVPVLFHTGTTGLGAGMPGGKGIRLKYSQPIPYLDDVAADFPELTIIGAHPSWPWQEEMLAVALHKANVYIDLSGWSPKYFPPSLIHYANTFLQDKCMFGSDFPALTAEKWLKDFQEASFKETVRPKILLENAKRILKI